MVWELLHNQVVSIFLFPSAAVGEGQLEGRWTVPGAQPPRERGQAIGEGTQPPGAACAGEASG